MATEFDPNGAATIDSGIFGLPHSVKESRLVLLPVPWEATTSYGGGTAKGPEAIFDASHQVDLFDLQLGRFYEAGIAMLPISKKIMQLNKKGKTAAQKVIRALGLGKKPAPTDLKMVNRLSEQINAYVYDETKKLLNSRKRVGLVGGDHSTPFGCIQAHLENYPEMGILHFDAHADLRVAYEGFEYSHASIMYNVIDQLPLKKLVQVGIRDFCEQEFQFIEKQPQRIQTYFDSKLSELKFSGQSWESICNDIVSHLPQDVYVSFDIDGLDPELCPHTGTPVPGGMSFNEACFILRAVVQSGRRIVGFDLNEVSPGPKGDEWDANVGARLLFKMCGYTLA